MVGMAPGQVRSCLVNNRLVSWYRAWLQLLAMAAVDSSVGVDEV